jgi:hypothetical protein
LVNGVDVSPWTRIDPAWLDDGDAVPHLTAEKAPRFADLDEKPVADALLPSPDVRWRHLRRRRESLPYTPLVASLIALVTTAAPRHDSAAPVESS